MTSEGHLAIREQIRLNSKIPEILQSIEKLSLGLRREIQLGVEKERTKRLFRLESVIAMLTAVQAYSAYLAIATSAEFTQLNAIVLTLLTAALLLYIRKPK